jgi:hypothetical protein
VRDEGWEGDPHVERADCVHKRAHDLDDRADRSWSADEHALHPSIAQRARVRGHRRTRELLRLLPFKVCALVRAAAALILVLVLIGAGRGGLRLVLVVERADARRERRVRERRVRDRVELVVLRARVRVVRAARVVGARSERLAVGFLVVLGRRARD